MEEATATNTTNSVGVKSDPDTIINKFYSVQFSLNNTGPTYLFKLRNTPKNGLYVLVKENSNIFKQLKVGDILNIKYNPMGSFDSSILKTLINSKNSNGGFNGHSMIGLSIIDGQHERLWTIENKGTGDPKLVKSDGSTEPNDALKQKKLSR